MRGEKQGKRETYIEEEGIFADSLNWFDKKGGQFAFDVDQMVQRLFGGVWGGTEKTEARKDKVVRTTFTPNKDWH